MAKRSLTQKQLLAGFGGKSAQKAARGGSRKSSTPKATPSRKSSPMSKLSRIGQRLNLKRAAIRAGAGAVATYSPAVAGDFGPGLTLAVAGIATKDDALATMGEVSLGAALARSVGGAAGYAPAAGSSGLV